VGIEEENVLAAAVVGKEVTCLSLERFSCVKGEGDRGS
jgi:hypothetical protein